MAEQTIALQTAGAQTVGTQTLAPRTVAPQTLQVSRVEFDAPVHRVTVFEDRAQVVRAASLELAAGFHRLSVKGVTPLAGERSLQLKAVRVSHTPEAGAGTTTTPGLVGADGLVGGDGLVVADCQLIRARIQEERRVDVQALVARQEALTREKSSIEQHQTRKLVRISWIERWIQDNKRRFAAGLPRGVPPEPLLAQLDALFQELAGEQARLLETQEQLERLNEELERITQGIQNTGMSAPTRYEARIEALVEVQVAGTYALELTYVTPCALWRPEHEARLETVVPDGKTPATLRFLTQAVVWQNTGESWENITLLCSTARPGRLSSPPLLTDDVLSARRKVDVKTVVAEVREEEIQTAGLGSGNAVASDMPGVDDGGEALSWTVTQPVTVPSTGQPVRALLQQVKLEATCAYVCLPERLPQVLLRGETRNGSSRPILAGPVVLYREGGYVGRTKVSFVAPGEKFRLSFGSLNGVRVDRTQQVKHEETRITGYQTVTLTVNLALGNQSDEAVQLEVIERVPVSELEEVRVTLGDRAPGKPDEEGLVAWNLKLDPRAQVTAELVYRVEAPARVHLPY